MGTLLVLAGLFNQLNANYCPKCTKIEIERTQEETKEGYQKNEYYEDYKKQSQADLVQPNSSMKTKNENSVEDKKSTEHLSNILPQISQQWLAALNSEKSVSSADLVSDHDFPEKVPLTINQEANDPNPNGNNSSKVSITNQNSSGSFQSDNSRSTISDILSIRSFLEIFEKPFTILAPSDEAIERFPTAAFNKILHQENRELLFSYLTNHVIPHQILRQDFNKPFKTLGGRIVEIESSEDGLTVNQDAKVLKSLPLGNNGILYVIDRVLIPIHE